MATTVNETANPREGQGKPAVVGKVHNPVT